MLFEARFLLYDLTSTYSDPLFEDKHRYSRDKRPDCVQVVVALDARGLSAGLRGDAIPPTALTEFLEKIERQYGRRVMHSRRGDAGPDARG